MSTPFNCYHLALLMVLLREGRLMCTRTMLMCLHHWASLVGFLFLLSGTLVNCTPVRVCLSANVGVSFNCFLFLLTSDGALLG